jgi:predicted HicB family RNase H-like nuclease
MKDTLEYKGFIGSVHFSMEDRVFHGKIKGINDLVAFEGNTVDELITDFQESVDDYIKICKEQGKEPMKSCKGSFNIRISPELHRKALEKSLLLGISLNHLIQKAIKREIDCAG